MPINYKEYPTNWKTEIRPAVLARADNCCEFCGIPNYTIKENGTKVVLTIAHLDHDKLNHDVLIDRLKALCQKCHLTYDIEHHVSNRKYGRSYRENNYKLDL